MEPGSRVTGGVLASLSHNPLDYPYLERADILAALEFAAAGV